MNETNQATMSCNVGKPVPFGQIPVLDGDAFQAAVTGGVERGWRVSSLFGMATPDTNVIRLVAVLADDGQSLLHLASRLVAGNDYESMAPECPQLQLFEREIAEQYGIAPRGHPWLKPVRYVHSWNGRDAWGRAADRPIQPGVGDFFRVEGEQVHEVAVGPVHAGIIEPGHFRFQCHGEQVFHLEIALGYQHRGVERALLGGPHRLSLHHAETLAGDTTIGHASCYAQALEGLAGCRVGARGQALRGIALELERLANHVGDLGAISGDVGFLPTMSYCGRIRGDFLNMSALLCGSRFGRGMVLPGGVGFDLDDARRAELLKRLETAAREADGAIRLLWENQSVMARLEETGPMSRQLAVELGMVGPAARAAGLERDVRFNQPSGIYRLAQVPMSVWDTGDVFARAYVRWLEIQQSVTFIREQLDNLPAGGIEVPVGPLAPDSLVVTMNEGWRGEICHVVVTGADGRFARYKIVDPSFHNWRGLAQVLRNQEISDFPLCNKSFNLSYCGHDL